VQDAVDVLDDQIKTNAEKNKQALSQYVKEQVFRESNQLTRTQLREIYFSLAKLRDLDCKEEKAKNVINQECDLIWRTLRW